VVLSKQVIIDEHVIKGKDQGGSSLGLRAKRSTLADDLLANGAT
jgi:hypothetical protein